MINEFLAHIEVIKNYSPLTVRNYRSCLRNFVSFSGVASPENITLDHVISFQYELKKRNKATSHIALHLAAIRSWLKWLAVHGKNVLPYYKIETPKYDYPKRTMAHEDEVTGLINSVQGKGDLMLRNKAIFEVLYSTGMRCGELCKLRRESVDMVNREIVVEGKGRKRRVCFLSDRAAEALKAYLEKRTDDSPALFLSTKKTKQLTKECIEREFRLSAAHAGIKKKITPHSFRHSFATNLLKNGADLFAVKEMLGHSSVMTTQIYLHYTNSNLKKTHGLYHT